jgi:Family of unknown function (DUF6065)
MFKRRQPMIEFLCQESDRGVIAEPFPAREFMPSWFKRLPAVDKDNTSVTNDGQTIKRCMPFLDAMTAGWIVPLASDVRLEIKDGGRTVEAGWDFDRTMVTYHNDSQVAGHPQQPRPACKFHNFWSIRTASGVSCLFIPPLNRPNPVFEVIAGVVDTDKYVAHINFPFFPMAPDGLYRLEKGTPLVQVIPFRRNEAAAEGVVKTEASADTTERERIFRNTQSGNGWYRRFARAER